MACVRVLVYHKNRNTILKDLVVSDPDRNPYDLADVMINRLNEHFTVEDTQEVLERGEII